MPHIRILPLSTSYVACTHDDMDSFVDELRREQRAERRMKNFILMEAYRRDCCIH